MMSSVGRELNEWGESEESNIQAPSIQPVTWYCEFCEKSEKTLDPSTYYLDRREVIAILRSLHYSTNPECKIKAEADALAKKESFDRERRWYPCDICGTSEASYGWTQAQFHKQKHLNEGTTVYHCNHCNKDLIPVNYIRHLEGLVRSFDFSDKKKQKCPYYEIEDYPINLVRHIRAKHPTPITKLLESAITQASE